MIDINLMNELLSKQKEEGGPTFDVQPIPGEVPTFAVVVDGCEELPIYVSSTDEEVLCICHLADESEINPDTAAEMHLAMLNMNVPMPLSSFGKIGSKYVVFGALSAKSDAEDLAHELVTLNGNGADALEAIADYLK